MGESAFFYVGKITRKFIIIYIFAVSQVCEMTFFDPGYFEIIFPDMINHDRVSNSENAELNYGRRTTDNI